MNTMCGVMKPGYGQHVHDRASCIIQAMGDPPVPPIDISRRLSANSDQDDSFWQLLGVPFVERAVSNYSGYAEWFRWLKVVFRSRGVQKPEDCADLAHDTLAFAWQKRQEIQPGNGRKFILNQVTSVLRKHRDALDKSPTTTELGDEEHPSPERPESSEELLENFQKVLKRHLHKGEATLLMDYIVDDISYEQISAKLGIEYGAARKRVQRALERVHATPAIMKAVMKLSESSRRSRSR
jgi:RNA polymerase sigma factor (sigma-70 family)